MDDKVASWLIRRRATFLAIIVAVTAFFAYGLKDTRIATIFSDLLPSNDPFVQAYLDHPNFGNVLSVQIMLKRTDGTIYNPDTLKKIWDLSRAIDLAPAIDHDAVLSVATEKARYAEATPKGIDSKPLMGDHPPRTPEEIREFRARLAKAPNLTHFLISADGKATLLRVGFIERLLDYGTTFDFVQHTVEQARCLVRLDADGACPRGQRDTKHEVYAAGQPMLTGWVYRYESEMLYIFAITLGMMLLLLALYTRNLAGILTPIVVSIVCAVWGFGFAGWMGYTVEPLILIVPLLLVARSISHSVQQTERYYETLYALGDPKTGALADKKVAAYQALRVMLAPGVVGIITDVLGLYLVAVAPIPMLQKFALFSGWWAVALIPGDAFLTPVLLSYLPTPRNVAQIVSPAEKTLVHRSMYSFLSGVARLAHGRRASFLALVVGIVTVASVWIVTTRLELGNAAVGSAILRADSEYNRSVREIDARFPGLNSLEILFEGKWLHAMVARSVFDAMQTIQRDVEQQSGPPTATLSMADYVPQTNRLLSGGNPKWLPVDEETDHRYRQTSAAMVMMVNPKNLAGVADFTTTNGTISLWYMDKTEATVRRALAQAQAAIAKVPQETKDYRIRMASGSIALQHATNKVMKIYPWIILAILVSAIFVTISLAYKSLAAGLILLVSVNLANLLLLVSQVVLSINLDVNTMPVVAIGIGVGIDYGIYLLSRICEEYQVDEDFSSAIDRAVTTTGKAIFFTATVVVVGILPWYFLSSLKFLADMGLLLVLIMLINAVLALFVIPLLVWLIKPEFVRRRDQPLGKSLERRIG